MTERAFLATDLYLFDLLTPLPIIKGHFRCREQDERLFNLFRRTFCPYCHNCLKYKKHLEYPLSLNNIILVDLIDLI